MERVYRMCGGFIAVVFVLSGAALVAWGGLLLGAQCFAWLKFGYWQQIPAFAALLTPDAQTYQLVPLALFEATWSPLTVAPSIGSFVSPDAVSLAIAGEFLGVAKLVAEVIGWPLSAWMTALGIGVISVATRLGDN